MEIKVNSQSKTSKTHVRHDVASFASKAKQTKSKTLMRKYVKKPSPSLKRQIKISPDLSLALNNTAIKIIDKSTRQKNYVVKVNKSANVSHFNPKLFGQSSQEELSNKVFNPAKHQTINTLSSPAPKTKLDIMLENALISSDSHLQPPPKKIEKNNRFRNRLIIINLLFVIAVVSVVGFNINSLKLDVASLKTGFVASMPKVTPSGFSLNNINYGFGYVNTIFTSGASSYTISQKASSLNSQALVSDVIAPCAPSYNTSVSGNKTIYLYGQRQASWVNNGILYTIKSNGSLSDSQLVKIASSI